MNKILTPLLCLLFTAGKLSAQCFAGEPAGLVPNASIPAETVNIFSFPPVFGQFDSYGEDSLDLNRDGHADILLSCGACNTIDCDGGYAQVQSLRSGVEVLMDSLHAVRQLMAGMPVNDTAQYWAEAQYSPLVVKVYGIGGYMAFGNWITPPLGFIGVRIKTATDTLYGWIETLASVSANGTATVKVQKWALEHDPATSPYVKLSAVPSKAVYCAGDTLVLHAETMHADHIAWHFWDGSTDTNATVVRVLPGITVPLTFTAENQAGVSSRDILLGVSPLELTVTGGVLTCSSPSLELTATTNIPADIRWIVGNDTFPAPAPPLIQSPGPILVIARDGYGCTVVKQLEITLSQDVPLASIQDIPGVDSLFVSPIENQVLYAWILPGSTDTVFATAVEAVEAGIYILIATNTLNGCSSTASYQVLVSGVDPDPDFDLTLFPNPLRDFLSITNRAAGRVEYAIVDIRSGLTLKQGEIAGNTRENVDLSALNPGVFLFMATEYAGTKKSAKKIVKL